MAYPAFHRRYPLPGRFDAARLRGWQSRTRRTPGAAWRRLARKQPGQPPAFAFGGVPACRWGRAPRADTVVLGAVHTLHLPARCGARGDAPLLLFHQPGPGTRGLARGRRGPARPPDSRRRRRRRRRRRPNHRASSQSERGDAVTFFKAGRAANTRRAGACRRLAAVQHGAWETLPPALATTA